MRRSRLIDIACIAAVAVFGLLAITPVAFLGFGIAIRTRPYLIIDENAVVVKALIGSAQETYGLTAADVIEFDGKRVFLVNQGGRRRLRGVTGWLANRHDWAAFRVWAERRRGARGTWDVKAAQITVLTIGLRRGLVWARSSGQRVSNAASASR